MRTPNENRSASDNTLVQLKRMVGQTVTARTVADKIGELASSSSAAMCQFERAKCLKLEKRVGLTKIYQVLPAISKRELTGSKRPRKYQRTQGAPTPAAGAYTVVSNIPLPGAARYPLAKMKIGDSFGVKEGEAKPLRAAVKAFAHANKNKRYTVRKHGKTGVRCWRIK